MLPIGDEDIVAGLPAPPEGVSGPSKANITIAVFFIPTENAPDVDLYLVVHVTSLVSRLYIDAYPSWK